MGLGAAMRIPNKVLGRMVLKGVDAAVESRWPAAVERAARVPGGTREHRVGHVTRAFTRELAALGAAGGGVAAVPGVGTASAVAGLAAEVTLYTTRLAELVLTIAALHGHEEPSVAERRAWVLAVLALGEGSSVRLRDLARGVGRDASDLKPAGLSTATLNALNNTLARRLLLRFGSRRAIGTLGRLLPLGVGALVGAGANTAGAQAVARHADRFFGANPPERTAIPATSA